MSEIDTEQLRKTELDILDAIDCFCKENGIKYWLDKGTLLGAVRHKGYIPWDDDIDIGLLREDYDKFAESFKTDGRFKFISLSNEPNIYCPYGKVVDTSTLLVEDNKYLLSVNIDVIVYDKAPGDKPLCDKMFDTRDRLRTLWSLRNQDNGSLPHGVTGIIKKLRRAVLRLKPAVYYLKKMVGNAKKFSDKKTNKVGNFLEYGRCVVDSSVFSETIPASFEGRTYPIPKGYDKLLTAYYGDYMKPPEKAKQVTHHSFVAYKTEDKNEIETKNLCVFEYVKDLI